MEVYRICCRVGRQQQASKEMDTGARAYSPTEKVADHLLQAIEKRSERIRYIIAEVKANIYIADEAALERYEIQLQHFQNLMEQNLNELSYKYDEKFIYIEAEELLVEVAEIVRMLKMQKELFNIKFSSLPFKAPASSGFDADTKDSVFGQTNTYDLDPRIQSIKFSSKPFKATATSGFDANSKDHSNLCEVKPHFGENQPSLCGQTLTTTTPATERLIYSKLHKMFYWSGPNGISLFADAATKNKSNIIKELIAESSLVDNKVTKESCDVAHEFFLAEEKPTELVEDEEKDRNGTPFQLDTKERKIIEEMDKESNGIEENIQIEQFYKKEGRKEDTSFQQYRSKSCRNRGIFLTPIPAKMNDGDVCVKKIPDNGTTYMTKNNMLDSRMKKKYHYVKKLIYEKMITLLKKRSNALEIDKKTLLQSIRKRREQFELAKYSQQILFQKVGVVTTIWELLIPWQLMLEQIWRLHKTELLNITLKATLELGARCPGRYKGGILAASQHFNSQKVIEAPVNQPMMEVNEVPNPQVIVQQETLTTSINDIKELQNIVKQLKKRKHRIKRGQNTSCYRTRLISTFYDRCAGGNHHLLSTKNQATITSCSHLSRSHFCRPGECSKMNMYVGVKRPHLVFMQQYIYTYIFFITLHIKNLK